MSKRPSYGKNRKNRVPSSPLKDVCPKAKHISFKFADGRNKTRFFYRESGGYELFNYDIVGDDVLVYDNIPLNIGDSAEKMFAGLDSLETVVFNDAIDTSGTRNLSQCFADCSSLKSVDLRPLNLSHTTVLSKMFSGCSSLEEVFFPENLLDFPYARGTMFDGCSALRFENIHTPVRFPATAYIGYQNLPCWDGDWIAELSVHIGFLGELPALAMFRAAGFFRGDVTEDERKAIEVMYEKYSLEFFNSQTPKTQCHSHLCDILPVFCEFLSKEQVDLATEAYMRGVPMEDIMLDMKIPLI